MLAVESLISSGRNGHFDKCSCAAVQNEVHILFHVKTCLCALRKKFSFLFFPFCQSFSVEAPLHALPRQTVFDFLSQRHNKLRHLISDITFFWRTSVLRPATSLTARLAFNLNL